MSKRLKLVSVRLKSDRGVYKNATFATATDVAFLMAKEIAEFDNETQDSDSIRGGFSNPVSQSSFRGYRSIRDG